MKEKFSLIIDAPLPPFRRYDLLAKLAHRPVLVGQAHKEANHYCSALFATPRDALYSSALFLSDEQHGRDPVLR